MKSEKVKTAVSKYLTSQGIGVLDMFYKMPCDSCKTIDTWDKFLLVPDFIIILNNVKYLAFVVIDNKFDKVQEYIKNHEGILNFKIYSVEDQTLFELDNLYDIKSKKLLTNKLLYEPDESVGTSQRTFKSQEGKWEENRRFGLLGEKETIGLLKALKAKIIDLNFNAPCDDCSNIQNWRKYNKLPDGIAEMDGEIFFFDAKAKSNRYFRVNERDYIEYQKRSKFLPVKIYFVIFILN